MDDIAEKLKKLLRLTESPNQHEAQLALQKAQELAMKYGYSLEELNTATVDKVIDVEVDDKKNTTGLSKSSGMIARTIAPFFRVKTYRSINHRTKEEIIMAIGLVRDVTAFTLAYQFTVGAFETLWKYYNKANPSKNARRVRNDYLLGFLQGCKDRLAESSQEYGLMLIVPNAVMKVYNDRFPVKSTKYTRSSIHTAGDANAYFAGKRDGQTLKGNTLSE